MPTSIRIVLADDHPLFREGVARTLSAEPGFEVVEECTNAEEAVVSVCEEQILKRVLRGLSTREIADELVLSEKTVKHYMTNILQKLQVRNRVEAALKARERYRKTGGT